MKSEDRQKDEEPLFYVGKTFEVFTTHLDLTHMKCTENLLMKSSEEMNFIISLWKQNRLVSKTKCRSLVGGNFSISGASVGKEKIGPYDDRLFVDSVWHGSLLKGR